MPMYGHSWSNRLCSALIIEHKASINGHFKSNCIVNTHTHTHTHARTHTHTHAHTHTYTYTHKHTHTRARERALAHPDTRIRGQIKADIRLGGNLMFPSMSRVFLRWRGKSIAKLDGEPWPDLRPPRIRHCTGAQTYYGPTYCLYIYVFAYTCIMYIHGCPPSTFPQFTLILLWRSACTLASWPWNEGQPLFVPILTSLAATIFTYYARRPLTHCFLHF